MPEKTPEELALEKAREQFAREIESFNRGKEELEIAREQLEEEREEFEAEKREFEKNKPDVPPEPEKPKPWERKKEYTVKSDLMYNGKVLKPGKKSNFSKLNNAHVQRLESGEVIE